MNKTDINSVKSERIVYAAIWSRIALLPVVLEFWNLINDSDFEWRIVIMWWIGMVPLVAIFTIHDRILLPRYMKKNRMRRYFLILCLVLSVYGGLQYVANRLMRPDFVERPMPPGPRFDLDKGHQMPPRPFPFPIVFKILLAAMTLGLNTAISLIYAYSRELVKRKELENNRLQEELKYLKQQISPHFLMNVLNNIHEMAEENIKEAQDMILELSCLMRYVLYEGENAMTTLAAESRFISSYVSLMKKRYVEGIVDVNLDIPEQKSVDVCVPPLLFISFIENAFKHGVSYSNLTTIDIKLYEQDGKIFFSCDNTIPQKRTTNKEGGVGLTNVKRRLDLLYGEEYSLRINQNEDTHSITLIIPSR